MRCMDRSCGGWSLAALLAAQSPALVLAMLPLRVGDGAGLCYNLYFHT